jgi:hypothetical protein
LSSVAEIWSIASLFDGVDRRHRRVAAHFVSDGDGDLDIYTTDAALESAANVATNLTDRNVAGGMTAISPRCHGVGAQLGGRLGIGLLDLADRAEVLLVRGVRTTAGASGGPAVRVLESATRVASSPARFLERGAVLGGRSADGQGDYSR